jgi:hypothetical protein
MAYYDTINVVAGDDKPDISLTLRDSNSAAPGVTLDPEDPTTWAPINLTDPAVYVKFRLLGAATILDTMTCVVTAATAGQCYMPWNLTTLDVAAGTYEGEIEIVYSDARVLTIFDKLKFKVRDDF